MLEERDRRGYKVKRHAGTFIAVSIPLPPFSASSVWQKGLA